MGRRRRIASERLKLDAARTVGFDDKVRDAGWEQATTEEIGLMVGEMIRRGKRVIIGARDRDLENEIRS